jgi:hypothetical protein
LRVFQEVVHQQSGQHQPTFRSYFSKPHILSNGPGTKFSDSRPWADLLSKLHKVAGVDLWQCFTHPRSTAQSAIWTIVKSGWLLGYLLAGCWSQADPPPDQ